MVAPEPAEEPAMLLVIVPIVQVKLLGALDVKAMFVETPLQILFVDELVTAGAGFTVTVMVVELPAQEPAVDVGVTTYSILPAVALLGLVNVWLIVEPELATAPLILPVLVPSVQLKLLGTLAVNATFGPVPLQIVAVVPVVTAGIGFTVTVMVKAAPAQEPDVEVGVTRYCTVPEAELLGLINVCPIVAPELALEPVIPPVIVPIVQLKLLATPDVKDIAVDAPLQILFVEAFVTTGIGFTVTVMVDELPAQEPEEDVGVTI